MASLYPVHARNHPTSAQNLGTIKCSNLCTEIVEYTSPEETAVCNLASIALPRYVRERDIDPAREPKKLVGSLDAENRCARLEEWQGAACVRAWWTGAGQWRWTGQLLPWIPGEE